MKLTLTILLIAFPLLAAYRPLHGQQPAGAFDAVVDEFFERYFEFYPTAAAGAGLHEYDARLGARDAGAIEAWILELRGMEERFASLEGAPLTPDQALDRDLILREIRGDLFWLEDVETWRRDPRYYAGQMDMTLLLLLDYAPLAERMASVVSRLEQFPALIAAARANVQEPPAPFVETALITYRGWPRFLENDLTEALAAVADPDLQARFRAARDGAAAAVRAYAAHLESEVLPSADGEFALGPARYRRMNALLAGVDLPIDRLKAIAETELERLQTVADSLAGVIAPGAPAAERVSIAFDSLATDRPQPDEIVETAARVIERLRSFTADSEIGTVLPGEVQVREIPPFARTNFAYIWIPGPFEEEVNTGFYFIQPVEEQWSEEIVQQYLSRNNDWAILNVSDHEAYPGHYHHFNHVNRAPTTTQRLLTAYVTTEGWAHYVEEMSWREGLAGGDPKLGMAAVQDALLRVVRFLSSIGLHTEGMSVDEAEQMFATVAYQDSVNARQQALRGTYDPEYLNYTLGKLMIHRLREEARAAAEARGEAFDLTAFHDDFMSHGAPPVTWIGRRMLGDPDWTPFEAETAASPEGGHR
ncbi:MAG TPA: DUF885 domain-containing protein [Gemmatimonadota bacterium]|nr:DUF885 domain-containing protein [Gemmatimonadota bacterium]